MEESKKKIDLIVSEGKLPLWKAIISSALITLSISIIFYTFHKIYQVGFNNLSVKFPASMIKLIVLSAGSGISLAITKTILIDIENDKLISRYSIGFFSKDVLSKTPRLEYVSVFLEPTNEQFEVNLWYNKNKHYKMFVFEKKEDAFEFGKMVSCKLNIDLLDATEKGNFKWIDKTEL